MSKRSKSPEMPTKIRAMRRAKKAEDIPLTLTPAERIFTGQSFPEKITSVRELVLYSRLRELLAISPETLAEWKVPSRVPDLYAYDHLTEEIDFSVEQLELIETHFEALVEQNNLPNQKAILTIWEKTEEALDEDLPDEDPVTTNTGEQMEVHHDAV
jgi:hypothetical protein